MDAYRSPHTPEYTVGCAGLFSQNIHIAMASLQRIRIMALMSLSLKRGDDDLHVSREARSVRCKLANARSG